MHLGQKKNLDELDREEQQMKELSKKEKRKGEKQLKQLKDDDVYCLNRQEKWNQENQRMRSRVAEDSRWVKHAEWKDLLEKWINCRFEWYKQVETRGSHYQEYRRTLAAVMHGSER